MKFFIGSIILSHLVFLSSCTFNYNEIIEENNDFPEISMEKIEYTRVRDGKLMARLQAESGERYETKHLMNLKNYKFEQYDSNSGEVDSEGSGGSATVEITNNNVHMNEGAAIRVDTEDFELDAVRLDWDDKAKVLRGGENTPVQLRRGNGDEVNGNDFHADVRKRSWVFGANVHGIYNNEDSEETPAKEGPTAVTPTAGTPANGTPANGTPANGTPAAGTPANGTPASGTGAETPAAGTQPKESGGEESGGQSG